MDYGLVATRSLRPRRWREYCRAIPRHSLIYFLRTCFWAGDTFSPKLKVKNTKGEDISIQSFLQDSFLNAWSKVAEAVGDLDGVIGFEVSHSGVQQFHTKIDKIMNEPHRGYIDLQSMHAFDYNTDLHLGPVRKCASIHPLV